MRTPTMPRFLLALTLTLTALTFALALTARAWGETQLPHPALRGFVEGCEGKPQPCWYGISAGWDDGDIVDAAEDRLIEHGYILVDDLPPIEGNKRFRVFHPRVVGTACDVELAYWPETERVNRINLDCRNLNLRGGDLLATLGSPDRARYTYFSYENRSIMLYVGSILNLYTSLERIQMPPVNGPSGFPWRGLMPEWKHCQIWPESCLPEG